MKLINSGLEFKGTPGDLSWDYATGHCGLKAGNNYIASMYGEGEDLCQASPDHVKSNVRLLEHSKDMLVMLDRQVGALGIEITCLEKNKVGVDSSGFIRDDQENYNTKLSILKVRRDKIVETLKAICDGY